MVEIPVILLFVLFGAGWWIGRDAGRKSAHREILSRQFEAMKRAQLGGRGPND